ncbi:MAG: glycosyltransferase family 4 protein [Ferruginibacter sp.]
MRSVANLVEQLDGDGINFKIVCSDKDADGSVLNVKTDCWVEYTSNTAIWYCQDKNQKRHLLSRISRDIKPDIIFVNGIYSLFYSVFPLLFCNAPKKIISARGMLHPGALSQKSFKKRVFLLCWKLAGLQRRYEFHAVDEQEKKYIQQVFGEKVRVHIAPNFPRLLNNSVSIKEEGRLKLVSVALISPMKNHLLVIQALRHCRSYIEYNIYGPVKEPAYWLQCQQEILKLPANIQVNYHGEVAPEAVENLLGENNVFILPSKSENFGHAINEALSAGKPVITSFFTPWNNLRENKAGINIDIADIDSITAAIDFFASLTAGEYVEWGTAAVAFAGKKADTAALKKQYKAMFSLN